MPKNASNTQNDTGVARALTNNAEYMARANAEMLLYAMAEIKREASKLLKRGKFELKSAKRIGALACVIERIEGL